MWYYLLSTLFRYVLGNPILVLVGLAVAYLLIDRRYIGLLPDFTKPFRRRRRMARLSETIRLNPADANSQLELGALYLERGQAAQALPLLEKARERNNDSARVLWLLGVCYRSQGRTVEAAQALAQAVAINPKAGYGEPFYHLLAISLRVKPRDEAVLEEYRERILAYGSPEIFYRAGRALLAGGDRSAARTMFHEAIENYQASPKGFRRVHRRWAAMSWVFLRFGA